LTSQPLIDRKFLEKLERLAIHWQKSFGGLVGGQNTSRFAGAGQEFLDHRHFHHGDDVRAVNWRAYLRLEKLFMKMFHIEPRIPVRILLDVSRSMSTGDPAKFDYARRLAAAMGYIGLVRLEAMAIHPFSDTLGDPLLCSGGRHRFGPAVDFLTNLEMQGATNFFEVTRRFVTRYLQRGLLIILSDFLDDGDCGRPLQYMADFGHELFLIQVWAEEDRTPPWRGELELVDAETGAVRELDFDAEAQRRYTECFDAHAASLERIAEGNGGRYAGLPTSVSVEEAIFGPIARVGGVE